MTTTLSVLLWDSKHHNPNHYIARGIYWALLDHPSVHKAALVNRFQAGAAVHADTFDLLLVFDGEELDHALYRQLRARVRMAVLWVTEDPYELSLNRANAALFDAVFTNDQGSLAAYEGRAECLSFAGIERIHHLPLLADKDLRYDWFFAGTAWPNRVATLSQLLATGKRWRYKLALPSNAHLPAFTLPIGRSSYDWRLSGFDFARFAQQSRVTLLLPRIFSADPHNPARAESPPPRLFETAMAGSVQIVPRSFGAVFDYFTADSELLAFDDIDELVAHIDDMRQHPDRRYDIAMRAQQRALNEHSYRQRLDRLLARASTWLGEAAVPTSLGASAPAATKAARSMRVLHVAHNRVANGHFGGVEVYVQGLIEQLPSAVANYLYTPDQPHHSLAGQLTGPDGELLQRFAFSTLLHPYAWRCQEREAAFAEIIERYQIDVVHFHHLISHPFSLVEVAKHQGAGVILTMHDHYWLCHRFNLLGFDGRYCQPDHHGLTQCDVCLWHSLELLPGSQALRRQQLDRLLTKSDLVLFNTEGCRQLHASVFPALLDSERTAIAPPPSFHLPTRKSRSDGPVLRIAWLGNVTRVKGADTLARVLPLLKNHPLEIHIFGRIDPEYAWMTKVRDWTHLSIHGGYPPGDYPDALFDCAVSLHLSIWPETYCLTLSEAWACGLIPLVSDIGALGERVSDGVNGLTVKAGDEEALLKAMLRLVYQPTWRQQLAKQIADRATTTDRSDSTDNHLAQVASLYARAAPVAPCLALPALSSPTPSPWRETSELPYRYWPLNTEYRHLPSAAPALRTRWQRGRDLVRRAQSYRRRHGVLAFSRALGRYTLHRLRML